MEKINLQKLIKEMKKPWEPQNVVLVDETALRIAKIEGAYNWHIHREEDEFFLVLKGKIFIDTEEGSIELNEMEGYLVKKGTRHRSRTEKPAWVLLIEPIKTKRKGE